MKKLLIIPILIVALGSCNFKGRPLLLVSDGAPKFHIILPVNASQEEIRAASFLNKHMIMIAGCELPVTYGESGDSEFSIQISKNASIPFADDYTIETIDNQLVIKGGSGRGCVFAVSELLENYLGVQYYSPDYIGYPKTQRIEIPHLRISGHSPNTYRNVHGRFSEDEDYRDFHKLNIIDDMFAKGYYVHTFQKLIPWTEYFESHPEYYAYLNGKRIIDQLCLSNLDVLQIVKDKLKTEMALQPDKKYWSVSQDDNFSFCQCEQCSRIIGEEGSASGPIIRFVNQIAEVFPDKIISTLAYQYSRQAPKVTKPNDNVQVMLCTIELNRGQSIEADERSASFLKDLEEWGKISNHIYLWDYTVDFAHSISPFPNLHTLQPNIQLFVNNNVKEHFQQSNTGVGHEMSELKSFLLAKLLWNPNAPVENLTEQFTDGFYGPAGPWIRQYIYQLQREIIKSGEFLDIYGPPTLHQNTFLSAQNMDLYNTYFDEAEKAVAQFPDYLLHVKTARMPIQYAMMEIGKADMFGPRGWYREVDGEFIAVEEMITILESFYQASKVSKSAALNESGLTAEQYYASTKRFIDVQVKGNKAFRKTVTATPSPAQKYSDGNLAYLTNGVRGANDFKVHWLGWEAKDFSLMIDLEKAEMSSVVEISTLWDPKSWILHPSSVSCAVSVDGVNYEFIKSLEVSGNQKKQEINHLFVFNTSGKTYRYVQFDVTGTKKLFDWHPSAGGGSWVFVDEIVVR